MANYYANVYTVIVHELLTTTSYKDTFLQDFRAILKENPEEMFPLYYMHIAILSRFKSFIVH